jgi:hypothetical protein
MSAVMALLPVLVLEVIIQRCAIVGFSYFPLGYYVDDSRRRPGRALGDQTLTSYRPRVTRPVWTHESASSTSRASAPGAMFGLPP